MKYHKMKYDRFLEYLYKKSMLSKTTKKIYMDWVSKCGLYHNRTHPLDLAPNDLESYRLYLLKERNFSPASDVIIYNAMKHTYQTLLSQVDQKEAQRYAHLFSVPPRQPHTLPGYISQEQINHFVSALPHTVAGNIIRAIYLTSKPFDIARGSAIMTWRCSKAYAQQVCAKTARQVGIPHGFGLTGVRGASIIHRIQNRSNDLELARIKQESGLSDTQFELYRRVALTGTSE